MVSPATTPISLAATSIVPVLTWIGLLIAVLAVGGTILLVYRRHLFAPPAADHASVLQGLKDMRDSGQISPEEYDAARKSVAARAAGLAPPTPPKPAPPPADRVAPPGFDLTGAPLPRAASKEGEPPRPIE